MSDPLGTTLSWRGRGERGFTLIELMLAVSLILVLLAILLPALWRARGLAQRVSCSMALHGLGIAAATYGSDSFGELPPYYVTPGVWMDTFPMEVNNQDSINLGPLQPYVGDPATFYCVTQTDATSPSLAYNSKANPWNHGKGKKATGLSSSFATRSRDYAPDGLPRWTLQNYENKVIYTDFTAVDNWKGHGRLTGTIRAPHSGEGVNRLFGDGAVFWAGDARIQQQRPINSKEPNKKDLAEYYQLLDVLP